MTRSELDRMQEAAQQLFVSPHATRTVADGIQVYNGDVVAFRELIECVRKAITTGVRIDRTLAEEIRAGFDRLQEERAILDRDAG